MMNDVFFAKMLLVAFVLFRLTGYAEAQEADGARPDDIDVVIVHTNDTHSCIEPVTPNFADTAMADKGGFLRRVALVDSLRADNPNLLLFDCGDFSQGSPYYNIFKGDVEVSLMNRMKYDACAIGNHEFDFGLDNMVRLFRSMNFPVLCCNYDFSDTPVEGLVKPYVVIERYGLKIGVLGVSPRLEGLVVRENFKNVEYSDPIASVAAVAEYLKLEEQCDLIVCLSHLGWDTQELNDQMLIGATRHIDVVLGGHTHTYIEAPIVLANADGAQVSYSQMGKNARFVGVLRVCMEPIRK